MIGIGTVLVDFVMNNTVEVFIIGLVAYLLAGKIMRFADINLGLWFGRKGGRLLWLVMALMISGSYHWIKELFT